MVSTPMLAWPTVRRSAAGKGSGDGARLSKRTSSATWDMDPRKLLTATGGGRFQMWMRDCVRY